MTDITSEQATLLALMALVRRLGNRVVITPQELMQAAHFAPQSTVTDKHELIFEVITPEVTRDGQPK